MKDWLFTLSHEISEGNVSATVPATLLVDPTDTPLLCGTLIVSPESDPTATLVMTVEFGTQQYAMKTQVFTLTSTQFFSFTLPAPQGSITSSISYFTVVTGSSGSYTLLLRVK